MIGAELNSYGVVVKYEQRANHVTEGERKRPDMELWFDGKSVAVDYTCSAEHTYSISSRELPVSNTLP
jgi:hypothetical protein